MSSDPIIDKIRKLLRMKRGGTDEEVATALRLAQELANKHGIDLQSVDPNVEQPASKLTREDEILSSRMQTEAKHALNICLNHFHVEPVLTEKLIGARWVHVVAWCGTSWDIAVAKYVFAFLRRHFRQSWANRTNRRLRDRNAYLWGMYVGLSSKLRGPKKDNPTAGLVALNRLKEFVEEQFPKAKPMETDKGSDSTASQCAGLFAGLNTDIRGAIDHGRQPAPLQLTTG